MGDPGWDDWDVRRVLALLWPGSEDWPDREELWPDTAVAPPSERTSDAMPGPVRASDVEPQPGPLWITYWVWAVGTPFVKIGRAQYQADRDGRWRGKRELAERRIRSWSTGCMYPVELLRVHLADSAHEASEHGLRASARVMREREWFDLRRL